jgi:hypothetical protein
MKKLNIKDLKPIEGFKVMEWLRAVREKEYELYKRDPQEYFRQVEEADKIMQARIKRIKSEASKNLS